MKKGKSAASLLLVLTVMASCFTTPLYATDGSDEINMEANSLADDSNEFDVSNSENDLEIDGLPSESDMPLQEFSDADESKNELSESEMVASSANAQVQIPSSSTVTVTAEEEREPVFSSGQKGFIERLYYYILGRGAGSTEINYYVQSLANYTSNPSRITHNFFQSPEFQNRKTTDTEYIYILYRAILGREPDSSGLKYYTNALNSGSSRNSLMHNFLSSAEFKNLCNSFGLEPGSIDQDGLSAADAAAAQFVRRLYSTVLGRDNPAQSEVMGWVNAINKGTGAAQVAYDFFNSSEYKSKNTSNEVYIEALYKTILNRSADTSGKRYYLTELEDGVARNTLLNNFVNSAEFGNLCNSYGLNRGSISGLTTYEKNVSVAKFVQRQFKLVLGRSNGANQKELEDRVTQLVNGYSAAQQTYSFFVSDEFKNRNLSDEQYIEVLYTSLLGRGSDSSGRKYYLDQLANGASRNYILQSFLYSNEFGKICSSYGLTVGTANITDVVKPSAGSGNSNSGGSSSSGETLTVRYNGQNVTASVEEILVQTVYGEVGGFRNAEVYKAQAVAAYTYIKYHNNRGSIPTLPLVTPPAAYSNTVYAAVREVLGQSLTYNGSLAQTTYYAMSNGKTNSAKDMWGSNVAYLVSVDSSYDKSASGYQSAVTLTQAELKAKLEKIYGAGICDGIDFKDWIKITGTNSAGYVTSLQVCGTRTPKVEYFYQTIIGLRSPSFTVSVTGDKITFTVQGYGHGVGMSQWGAYYYATKAGWNYQQILAHYYPGTVLNK